LKGGEKEGRRDSGYLCGKGQEGNALARSHVERSARPEGRGGLSNPAPCRFYLVNKEINAGESESPYQEREILTAGSFSVSFIAGRTEILVGGKAS